MDEKKHIEREKERYYRTLESIFRSLKDPIITVDHGMLVIEANEATKSVCGLRPNKIIGKHFTEVLSKCRGSCQKVLRETLKRKKIVRDYRVECGHQARPHQVVLLTSSPLMDEDNRSIGAVLVIRALTDMIDLNLELGERHRFHNIIGKNSEMQKIYRILDDLADADTTVLITGESGTGKELVAEALHYVGIRSFKPLVKVNCSALPENLLESELFGHVKGAFTGAIKDKEGRFQAADGGTIFLDEIGDISPRIRLRLLRVLEEKKFERVGDSTSVKVDVRVIASTNRDLREKVKLGEFREDLYYRVKVVEIVLPPLRERLEDIPLLADHFVNLFKKRFKKNIDGISEEVLKMLMAYPWPGNVRELEHAIEHTFVLCHGQTITVDNLPEEIRQHSKDKGHIPAKSGVKGPQQILQALNKTDWNKAKAARLLGISRQTIYRKIEQHKLIKPLE